MQACVSDLYRAIRTPTDSNTTYAASISRDRRARSPLLISCLEHRRGFSRQNMNELHVAIGTRGMQGALASVVALAGVSPKNVDEKQRSFFVAFGACKCQCGAACCRVRHWRLQETNAAQG
jgi:hypothetical protein